MSKRCAVVATTACLRIEHICRLIAAELDSAQSLRDLNANDNSPAGGSTVKPVMQGVLAGRGHPLGGVRSSFGW